ncbi:MAG TPA: serine/threonine-protein kinase [Thermoanaerobaculia bacterium]
MSSATTPITCLRCKKPIDPALDQCPHCGDRVTKFQRTYGSRLIDGKYQILDRLGVGGMGEIFKVRHIHLNELRVIKIMRPSVETDEQALQRFLQEARTSTTIKHRNLAMLYDFARLEDGSYYMVWEFIDGVNIQKWIAKNGPMPSRLAVEVAIQALTGLDHLHSMGLIHRDVSAENIMLSQDHHGKLLVKVIDFGIAKSLAESEGNAGLTQTGMFLGKLKYASPEQAGYLKEGERLDPRTDLYSFGIVMYEMLSGRAPFQGSTPQAYILKHVSEKPPRIAEMNPQVNVPPQLESIVMKALAKNRADRFRSAAEFAGSLEVIRPSIQPDEKFGLGERMVTLSAAKTVNELPRYTPAAGTLGSNDPTIVERTGAEPRTLVEPVLSPATRRSAGGMIAGVVALIVLIGVTSFVLLRRREPQSAHTAAPSTAQVTATANAPVSPDHGVLLLSASPWGDIEQIVNLDNHKKVELSDDKRSTPTAIELEPGKYSVSVRGPRDTKTVDVQIEAGKRKRMTIPTADVNYDEIEREVKPQ